MLLPSRNAVIAVRSHVKSRLCGSANSESVPGLQFKPLKATPKMPFAGICCQPPAMFSMAPIGTDALSGPIVRSSWTR